MRMNRQPIIGRSGFILLLCLCSLRGNAAECQLRLEVDNVDWRGGSRVSYGAFDSGGAAQGVYFKVRLTGDPCPFFVTFGGTTGYERRAARGGDALGYEIYDSV